MSIFVKVYENTFYWTLSNSLALICLISTYYVALTSEVPITPIYYELLSFLKRLFYL